MTLFSVNDNDLAQWCETFLSAPPAEVLFRTGHLSRVIGLRLSDDREVVVKVRAPQGRLAACVTVQAHLWRVGFPCPRPLTPPTPLGAYAAHAETLVAGGELLPPHVETPPVETPPVETPPVETPPVETPHVQPPHAEPRHAEPPPAETPHLETPQGGAAVVSTAAEYAGLLAELLRKTPPVNSVGSLYPAPPWVHWDHDLGGIWPPADDRDDDLNAHPASAWLDGIGRRVRGRLERLHNVQPIIGHGDWEAQNLRWQGRRPWVVHDWDSLFSGPEVVIVGLAAAVWPAGTGANSASLDQTEAFLTAYQQTTGRAWSQEEVECGWAAGLWVRAFNAKKAAVGGDPDALRPDEARQLLVHAGL